MRFPGSEHPVRQRIDVLDDNAAADERGMGPHRRIGERIPFDHLERLGVSRMTTSSPSVVIAIINSPAVRNAAFSASRPFVVHMVLPVPGVEAEELAAVAIRESEEIPA